MKLDTMSAILCWKHGCDGAGESVPYSVEEDRETAAYLARAVRVYELLQAKAESGGIILGEVCKSLLIAAEGEKR